MSTLPKILQITMSLKTGITVASLTSALTIFISYNYKSIANQCMKFLNWLYNQEDHPLISSMKLLGTILFGTGTIITTFHAAKYFSTNYLVYPE